MLENWPAAVICATAQEAQRTLQQMQEQQPRYGWTYEKRTSGGYWDRRRDYRVYAYKHFV